MRAWLIALAALVPMAAAPGSRATDLKEPPFARGDLAAEIARADEAGRRLAIVFEQAGCRYCITLRTEYLADPEIAGYIRARFTMYSIDIHGSRPVVDLDGRLLDEAQLARRWCVTVTPSIVFLPDRPPARAAEGRCGSDIEVARMRGLLPRRAFLGMFIYVHERAYADGTSFAEWWAARSEGVRPTPRDR